MRAGNSDSGSGGQSKVTWWIIAVAVIAAVAAIAVGILAAFLVRRKRSPKDDHPKAPEPLLKVGAAATYYHQTPAVLSKHPLHQCVATIL